MTHGLTRAVVCRDLTGPDALRLEEIELPDPRAGEVRVAVRASGLNFPDLLMSGGKYQLKPALPFTLGFEAAGVVDAIGPGGSGHTVGDRVMVRQWWGCHAQALVAPTDALLPLPDGLSFEEGATFVVATSTAVNGVMQRGQLREGETLLVHGAAGGVGLAAVETGKLLGATVIATASSAAKLAVARARGADHGIDTTTEDFRARVMEITGGRGADVVFDPVGGEVFETSLRCMAWGGRILVVGFASGRIPEIRMNQPLLKCISIVGVRAIEHLVRNPIEGPAYQRWMLAQAALGHLHPHISHRFPLEHFRAALDVLQSRAAIGRVVLTMG
jgi:NADPH2:quinone reductase